jgi:hypothetical protein
MAYLTALIEGMRQRIFATGQQAIVRRVSSPASRVAVYRRRGSVTAGRTVATERTSLLAWCPVQAASSCARTVAACQTVSSVMAGKTVEQGRMR